MKNKGFQLIEILIAGAILVVAVGSVIALSFTASSGLKRSADVLFAVSLARLSLEKVLATPYDDLLDDGALYPIYEAASGTGSPPGPLFQNFESSPTNTAQTIRVSNYPDLNPQVENLNFRYQINVTELLPPEAKAIKQVLVTIYWDNKGNTYNYKLIGFTSKRF
jgi:hypothetical protein